MQHGQLGKELPQGKVQAVEQHRQAQHDPAHFDHKVRERIGRVGALRKKEPYPATDKQYPAQQQSEQGKLAGAFFKRGTLARNCQPPCGGRHKVKAHKGQQGGQRQGHAQGVKAHARQGKGLSKMPQRVHPSGKGRRHFLEKIHQASPPVWLDAG